MSESIKNPLPGVDWETRAYWEGAGRGELVLQRSRVTGEVQHPPRAVCARTLRSDVEHFVASGRGTVHTYTVTYQNMAPGFREALPYVLAYVELEEGPLILSNLVGCDPVEVRIGMPVVVDFGEPERDLAVPQVPPGMILDLHAHSVRSDDGRARVESYCQWIRKRQVPIEGLVLTEHRQFDTESDYRALEDEYGLLILKGSEVESDYGHVLVFGVNQAMTGAFDFAAIDLPLRDVLVKTEGCGGVAVPCHPGRPTVGLCAHYAERGPVEGVGIIETRNGGSRAGEDEAALELADRYSYRGIGGSDAHLVSKIGLCATRFERDIASMDDLVEALREGKYEAVTWRS